MAFSFIKLISSSDTLGSLSTHVFETRTATGKEHLAFEDPIVTHIFILLVSNGEKILSNVNVVVWGQVKSENSSLLVAVRVLKTRVLKDVRANCFCASLLRTTAPANSHATSCIERARQVLKWTMIRQMAIAIALLGFSDLGRSVTPTFLFRNRFYLQLSPHCSKMNKKSMWEVKKISRFLSTGHGILSSCGC